MKQYTFDINGHQVEAEYEETFIEEVVKPLMKQWEEMVEKKKHRIIVFLAAPPAAGKSTLAALFEYLSIQEGGKRIQALGMDGFHHYQSYILSHSVEVDGKMVSMKSVKGCPESFDYKRFKTLLEKVKEEDIRWPYYNRVKHEVEDDVIAVHAPIIVLEGNYLLLDEAPWKELQTMCDDSIFITTNSDAVKTRLINRKMKGGALPHEAVAFYENSDGKNVERVLAHKLPAHTTLIYDGKTYKKSK